MNFDKQVYRILSHTMPHTSISPGARLSADFLTKLQTMRHVMFYTVDLSCRTGSQKVNYYHKYKNID